MCDVLASSVFCEFGQLLASGWSSVVGGSDCSSLSQDSVNIEGRDWHSDHSI